MYKRVWYNGGWKLTASDGGFSDVEIVAEDAEATDEETLYMKSLISDGPVDTLFANGIPVSNLLNTGGALWSDSSTRLASVNISAAQGYISFYEDGSVVNRNVNLSEAPSTGAGSEYFVNNGRTFVYSHQGSTLWYSDDLVDWVKSPYSDDGSSFGRLQFAANGDTIVAIKANATVKVRRSTDNGETWSNITGGGAPSSVQDVCYGGGKFVIAGGSTTYTSANGASWSSHPQDPVGPVRVVYDDGKFYGLYSYSSPGGAYSFVSEDGITWESYSIQTFNTLQQLQSSYSLKVFGGNVYFGLGKRSADGEIWEQHESAAAFPPSVTYGNGVYLKSGGALGSLLSDDSVNWSFSEYEDGDYARLSVFGAGVFASIVTQPGVTEPIRYSLDGEVWHESNLSGIDWSYIAFSDDVFLVCGPAGKMARSEDGITWTDISNAPSSGSTSYHSITQVNGIIAALGSGNRLSYSTNDGASFTNTTVANSASDRLLSGSPLFVIWNTSSSSIRTSSNATSWTTRNVGTTTSSLVYGNGVYVAVPSFQQWARYSSDAITWNQSSPISGSYLVYCNGKFYNTLYESTDGASWSPIPNLYLTSDSTWLNFSIVNGKMYTATSTNSISYSSTGGLDDFSIIELPNVGVSSNFFGW